MNPILHVWSPSWPWAPDVTTDNGSVSCKVRGGRSRSRGPPWLSHHRAAPEPAHPPVLGEHGAALPRSDTRSYVAPRARRQHLTQDRGVELRCRHTCLQQRCGQDVPFPPAWQLRLGLGRAEPGRVAQHPPGRTQPRVLLAWPCSAAALAARPLMSCWRQEPSGQREGMPSACSTNHRTDK